MKTNELNIAWGRLLIIPFLMPFLWSCGNAQHTATSITPRLIGTCEGCEAVFESGDKKLAPTDTLPDFYDEGLKIKISGTIYQTDGKIPAKDVVLYVYHTDQKGIYPTRGDETGWARRHGYIRGWMKTDADGKYTFYTLKPGQYPNGNAAAHIHPVILEPDGKYYWIGEYLFEGDEFLTEEDISPKSPRGGSHGVLSLEKKIDLLAGVRDIVLGKNVPGYRQ